MAGEDPARGSLEVVIEDIRMIQLVGGVVKRLLARHPTGRRYDAVVTGGRLRVMPVKIRDIDLPVRSGVAFEGDFGLSDAFVLRNRIDKIIREGMGLPSERCAGVGFGNQRAFVVRVNRPTLQIAIVASREDILRRGRVRESEALDVQIELKHLEGFAGEPAHRDPDGRSVAGLERFRDRELNLRQPAGRER